MRIIGYFLVAMTVLSLSGAVAAFGAFVEPNNSIESSLVAEATVPAE